MHNNVAIIVGRFQVDKPHVGHHHLVETALEKCDKVVIFIGDRTVRGKQDPLSYEARASAVRTAFSHTGVEVYPLLDSNSDEQWLENLRLRVNEVADGKRPVYFGSRDSFLDYLPHDWPKYIVTPAYDISSTELREKVTDIDSSDFRKGYIKAVNDEFPSCSAVTDILVTDNNRVLLGYKEKFREWVTIGGFCDDGDGTMEFSACRELEEEAGLIAKPEDLTYVGSWQCDSWMYSRHRAPYTVAYTVKYTHDMGEPKAGDDIDKLMWFELEKAYTMVAAKHHKAMIDKLIKSK